MSLNEARSAIDRAALIGKPPAEVEKALAAMTFANGRRLQVDPFDPKRGLVMGVLLDAKWGLWWTWNLYAQIKFDSTGLARSVEVSYEAENPM